MFVVDPYSSDFFLNNASSIIKNYYGFLVGWLVVSKKWQPGVGHSQKGMLPQGL